MKSKIGAIGLLIGAILTIAAVLPEPWDTVLFLVVIPLVMQAIKLYFDKTGKTLGKLANQGISLVLALAFAFLSGGFLGIELPALPSWGGDFATFLTALTTFLGELAVLIAVSWGTLMVLYEAIWDRLFVKIGFATEDKL